MANFRLNFFKKNHSFFTAIDTKIVWWYINHPKYNSINQFYTIFLNLLRSYLSHLAQWYDSKLFASQLWYKIYILKGCKIVIKCRKFVFKCFHLAKQKKKVWTIPFTFKLVFVHVYNRVDDCRLKRRQSWFHETCFSWFLLLLVVDLYLENVWSQKDYWSSSFWRTIPNFPRTWWFWCNPPWSGLLSLLRRHQDR